MADSLLHIRLRKALSVVSAAPVVYGTTLRTQAHLHGQQRVFSISSAWTAIRPESVFRASPYGHGCGQVNYYRQGFLLSHQEPSENIYNYYF